MRLLLDTHVVLAVVNGTLDTLPIAMRTAVADADAKLFCSTASLWDIAITASLGKLSVAGKLGALDQT